MAKKTVTEMFLNIVLAIQQLKSEGKKQITPNQIRDITNSPTYVLNKYFDIFVALGKITIVTQQNERGIDRYIDIRKFDLEVQK